MAFFSPVRWDGPFYFLRWGHVRLMGGGKGEDFERNIILAEFDRSQSLGVQMNLLFIQKTFQ